MSKVQKLGHVIKQVRLPYYSGLDDHYVQDDNCGHANLYSVT